jgi:hypothetical protein
MKNILRSIVIIGLMIFLGCSSSTSPKPNLSPILAEFSGPSMCKKAEEAIFKAKGYDPDREKVSCHFGFWLTDDVEPFPSYRDLGYTPYVENNTVVTKLISFPSTGEYTVCCHCIDETKKESVHQQWQIIVCD